MHLPRAELWQEMLAVPQFVRFTFPLQNGDAQYPTLIIKAHSLLLKYIVQGVPLTLHFIALSDDRCAYVLHVADDPKGGVFLWSLLADADETAAIEDLGKHSGCSIYLFNEACTNCAWASASVTITSSMAALAVSSKKDDSDPARYSKEVDIVLDGIRNGATGAAAGTAVSPSTEWKPLLSKFIVNGPKSASLNLLFDNEGTYQEQLAHVLLGDLSPRGAFLNTQLHEPSGNKEFTDLVLTHEFGTILINRRHSVSLNNERLFQREKNSKRTSRNPSRRPSIN